LIGFPTSTRRLSSFGPPAAETASTICAMVTAPKSPAGVTGAGLERDLEALELGLHDLRLVEVRDLADLAGPAQRGEPASRRRGSTSAPSPRGTR